MLPQSNFTQFPNLILDNLTQLTNNEYRVISIVIRQTLGYHRKDHHVSISFLEQATGLSRNSVIDGTKSLVEKGMLRRSPSGPKGGFKYEINLEPVQDLHQSDFCTSADFALNNQFTSAKFELEDRFTSAKFEPKEIKNINKEIKERSVVLADDSRFSESPMAVVEPEPVEKPVTTATQGDGQLEKPKRNRTRKVSAAPKTADQIYAAIADLEAFNKFWVWYGTKVCTIPAQNASPGNKAEAGKQWLHLEKTNFLGKGFEQFRQGCKKARALAVETQGIGTRHACRFLCPSNNSPVWLEQLDDVAPAGDFLEDDQPTTADPVTRPAPVAIDVPDWVAKLPWQKQQDWMADQRRQISEGTWQAPQSAAPAEDIPADPDRLAELMRGLAA
jgi:phage replication O-like protein O